MTVFGWAQFRNECEENLRIISPQLGAFEEPKILCKI